MEDLATFKDGRFRYTNYSMFISKMYQEFTGEISTDYLLGRTSRNPEVVEKILDKIKKCKELQVIDEFVVIDLICEVTTYMAIKCADNVVTRLSYILKCTDGVNMLERMLNLKETYELVSELISMITTDIEELKYLDKSSKLISELHCSVIEINEEMM